MSHHPGSAFVLQVKVEAANADGKYDCSSTTANADDHANPDEVGIVSEPTGFLVIKNEPIEQSEHLPEQESGVNRGISYARDPRNQSNAPALQTENVSNLCNSANMEISAYENVVSIRTEKGQQLQNHTTSTLQLRKDTKDDGALKSTSDLANSLPLLTTNMPFSPESNAMVSPTAAAVNERDASHLDYHQLLASIGEVDPTSLISPTTPSDISNTAKDGSRFQCTKCQKSYKMKSSLRDHMRIHTGERPYKCYICPQSFRVKRQLDRHVAGHIVPEQFPATSCQVDNMDQSAENYIMSASSSNQVASTENEWSAAHGISADVLQELMRFTASKTTGLNIDKLNVQRRDPTYLHSGHQEIPANAGSKSNAHNSKLTYSSGVNVYSNGGIKRETIMPAGESSTPLINGEFQTTNGVKRRNTLTATSDVAHLENDTKKSRKSFPQLGTSLSAMQYNGVPLTASNCINGPPVLRQSPSLETEQEEATPAANTANQDGMNNLEKAEYARVNPVLEIIDVSSDEEASDELDLKQYPVSAVKASKKTTFLETLEVYFVQKKSRKSFPQLGTSLSAMQYNGVPLSASNCINGPPVLRQSPSLETEQEEATPAANTANQDGMNNLEKAEYARVNPVLEIIDVSSDEEASDELDLKQYPVSAVKASKKTTFLETLEVYFVQKKSRKSFPQLGTSLSAMQYNGVPLSASNCINGPPVLRQSPSLETEQEEATPAANTANQDGMNNLEKAEYARVNPVLEIIDVSSDEEASDELDLKQYPVSAVKASICNEPVSSTNAGTSIEQFMPFDKDSNGSDVSKKRVKSRPIFTIKLEDSFENQPNVCHGSSSLVDEVQKVALLHPENVFLVWAEKFSLDLTMAVARNWSNCFLCVRNFPLTSLIDLSTLVKTYHVSMVEIGPHAESYRLFSFGEYFLPPEIMRNDAFESLAGLESTIKQFADSKGKRLVNIFKSAGDAVSLYEVLREELKEDCFVTKM